MNFVIIGGSAAGVSAAEVIRKQDRKSKITLISDETLPVYSRCLLTYLIASAIKKENLYFKDKDFYQKNGIQTYLGKKACAVDAQKRQVSLQDGTRVSYDRLLLATGASAKLADVAGVDKRGVCTLRKIDDARAIIEMLGKVKEIAVLGGGLIGLRDACALRQRKKQITVVVKSPHILSQMVDKEAANIIAGVLERNGIKIITGAAAREIKGGKSVEGLLLDNKESLSCQLVVIGKGVKANTELAVACGLKTETGIIVNKFLRTSEENIFAAGDVAETFDVVRETRRINALWPCAVEQGRVAALNMLEKKVVYRGSLSMNSVDFFGLGCIAMGIANPKEEEKYEIISQTKKDIYRKFVLKKNRIVGALFVGDIRPAGLIGPLIKNRVEVSKIKDILLDDNLSYAKVMPLVAEFADCFKQEEYRGTVITF